MIFRPFRACCPKKDGFSDPGRWPGLLLVRPFGAHFGISSARTPGVQHEMWDMLSPKGEGCISDFGPRG